MPSPDTLERFIECVEQDDHAEAIEAFYAENASMRENLEEPRIGICRPMPSDPAEALSVWRAWISPSPPAV